MLVCTDPRDFRADDGSCTACGEPWQLEIADAWGDHTFTVGGCCEAVDAAAHGLLCAAADWPDDVADLMRELDAPGIMGAPLRRVVDDLDAGGLFLDCVPQVAPIDFAAAVAFVAKHHEHCRSLPGWRFGAGIWNGPTLLGVVIVGNVSGRGWNGRGWCEVRRLCLSRAIPATLRWRACSMLYRWAEQEAAARGYCNIVTYTLDTEDGMSLRYARWQPFAQRKPRKGWSSAGREREALATDGIGKTVWQPRRQLRPTAVAVAAREASDAARAALLAGRAARKADRLAPTAGHAAPGQNHAPVY